ncbi:MAG TPA: ATP-dependent Clp protease adapter ClpS [Chthoniobacterales bacterium]|nr:ATP-dependent Clp protease adapter ClpS [Chthoniobacterales bacterium]
MSRQSGWGRGGVLLQGQLIGQSAPASAIESPVIERETREQNAVDVPWRVVVHNDPVNLMSYVTMVFQKVFGFSRERAEKHMLEVHRDGRSIVWSGLRERAELYVQQLHGYLLLATLERTS